MRIHTCACTHGRYTLFIPAYPVGVLAEMALLYQALPFIEDRDMYSLSMPNKLNMGFSYLRLGQVCRGVRLLWAGGSGHDIAVGWWIRFNLA